jgi:hypothetical protein
MSNSVAEHRAPLPGLRFAVVLGFDAIATLCGLYGALLLVMSGELPAQLAREARAAVPLLVLIRLATVMAGRLHRWSFHGSGISDAARLTLSLLAGSFVFALACRTLPWSVYVLEFLLTTSLMAAFRFAPRFAEDFPGLSLVPREAEVKFAVAERPRRALNVIVALTAIVLTFPLWILIAVAIKLTSRGPVLYRQERVGLDLRSTRPLVTDPRRKHDLGGRPFMMYKF